MRRTSLPAWVVLLLLAAPGTPAEDHSAEEFTRAMLTHMGAVVEGCPQQIRDRFPDRIVVCAAYPKSFSFFKVDWETNIRRHDLRDRVAPSTPWTLRGNRYVREYEAGDIPVAVIFDDRSGRLAIAFVPPAPGEGEPAEEPHFGDDNDARDEDRPLVAGFGGVSMPKVIDETHVEPVFPDRFQIAKMDGSVLLSVVIDKDGTVNEVRVLRVQPPGWELEDAAVEAVRQWRYEPATLDGHPVTVQHTVRVVFARPGPS